MDDNSTKIEVMSGQVARMDSDVKVLSEQFDDLLPEERTTYVETVLSNQ